MEEECVHDKVMANFSYMTNPPKTPWVCSKCRATGLYSPPQEKHTYEELMHKFDNKSKGE